MWQLYLIIFMVIVAASVVWVNAIDKMETKHPEYKGEDFLNWKDDPTEEDLK